MNIVEVKIDIFEHTGQRAKIMRNLTISGLVDEIFKEFDDIPSDNPAKYANLSKRESKAVKKQRHASLNLTCSPRMNLPLNTATRVSVRRCNHKTLLT